MTTATYQPNPTAGMDTYINTGDETPKGTDNILSLNNNQKILIKFDVSGIPSPSICSSAVLSLYSYTTSSMHGNVYTAYSILSANIGWTEAGATWNTIDGSTNWAGSAGCSTPGTDYDASSIGSCVMNATWLHENQFSLTPSVVTSWFGASNYNYGVVIKTDEINSGFVYSSDETTYTAYRPKLVVVYSVSGVVHRRTFQPMGMRSGSRRPS
jgi:hypothetical protein